ncbi:(2Fe-2S)-binding protein [Carboxylicivirga marina]|uniref:(2Fe-2S)-binding protein n=1 Tax=Carboxylicivirga marina TaxID=2800988 RepID=UPI002593F497|nr:(2Fe-2S)-binding protein [uncultured Carboxylicivirga sp.]
MKNDIICYCRNVKRETVEIAIKNGAKSLDDIRWSTDACKGEKCKDLHPNGEGCEHAVKQMIIACHGEIQGPKCSCCGL